MKRLASLVKGYQAKPDNLRDLKRLDTQPPANAPGKAECNVQLDALTLKLDSEQRRLHASESHALLVVMQGMDASGKDSTIRAVFSGLNPAGCDVTSFKQPTHEERRHDFLWRCAAKLPARGEIGVFNRSYYEEVLVCKVHPDRAAHCPTGKKAAAAYWRGRYDSINGFEHHLVRNRTPILKLFLNISKEEQRQRFLRRLNKPDKQWKLAPEDLQERPYWDDYQAAIATMLRQTSTQWAPWYVVPADNKPFARLCVAQLLLNRLRALKLSYPESDAEHRARLAEYEAQLG